MNGVQFKRENGGLNRELNGSDHISGLIVYGEKAVEKTLLLSADELEPIGVTIETHPVLFYHVNEFFRINPGAKLYIQGVAVSDGEFSEIKVLQNFAGGDIRQLAICDFKSAVSTLTNALPKLNQIATDLGNMNLPLSILISVKIESAEMVTLTDLHTANERVSVVTSQDGGGLGAYLAKTNPSISNIGACLGAVSKAQVHESIGWVEKQNLVDVAYAKKLTGDVEQSREMDVICFVDGSKLSDYSPEQIQAINDKGYIFCVKHTGIAGTYFNDSFTATELDSDFAYIENNRTIDKAIREINKVLVPLISAPAYVDPDTGYLAASTVAATEAMCDDVLDQMIRDGELSGYKISINPNQQILKTSKLEVVVKLVPVGVLREIIVKIGLTLKTT